MSTRLIINIGSRGMSWRGVGEPGSALHENAPGAALGRGFSASFRPDEVVIGSVAAEPVNRELRHWCREHWDLAPRELEAAREAHRVRNAYEDPAQLGVDRWAALVAAREHYDGAVLIADCGTALTIDYLAEAGRHIGGLIAPGPGLMREALASGTRLQPVSRHAPVPRLFGTDTELAVSGGALAAAAGLLGYVADKTASRYGAPAAMLVTGGDAQVVASRLDSRWRLVPDLVLDGLELLAEDACASRF